MSDPKKSFGPPSLKYVSGGPGLAVLVDDLGHLEHRVDGLPPLWSK